MHLKAGQVFAPFDWDASFGDEMKGRLDGHLDSHRDVIGKYLKPGFHYCIVICRDASEEYKYDGIV